MANAYGGAYSGAYGGNDNGGDAWGNKAYGDSYYNNDTNAYGGNDVYGDNPYNSSNNNTSYGNTYGNNVYSQANTYSQTSQAISNSQLNSNNLNQNYSAKDLLSSAHEPSLKYRPPENEVDGSKHNQNKAKDWCDTCIPPEWLVKSSMLFSFISFCIALLCWYVFNDQWIAILFFVISVIFCCMCTKWGWKRCCAPSDRK